MDLTFFKDLLGRVDASAIATRVETFEAPVPDSLLLALFVVILLALHRAHIKATRRMKARLEAAYAAELVTANRRVHQARNELSKANLEIEHERQNKRRLQRRRPVRGERPKTRPLILMNPGAQPPRANWA